MDNEKLTLGANIDWRLLKRTDHPAAQIAWGAQPESTIEHGWVCPNGTWYSLCGWNAKDQSDGKLRTQFLAYSVQPCQACRDRYNYLLNEWLEQHTQWGE